MKDPVVSIIVPIYNSEQYLPQCLDSILSQTYTDFELLLVDDGSKDQSGSICDEYAMKDPRIRVFHKENGGVSAARNLALQEARGKYICFCDSDDEMRDCYLQTLLSIEEKTGADMVVGSVCTFVEKVKRHIPNILEDKKYGNDELGLLLCDLRRKGMLGVPWNKLFRKEIIKDHHITFDINTCLYEDEIFILEYLQYVNKVVSTKIVIYNYILRPHTSLSQTFRGFEMHHKLALAIYNLEVKLVMDPENQKEIKVDYMSRYVHCMVWQYTKTQLSRRERLRNIELISSHIPKGFERAFQIACKRQRVFFKNKYLIDISMLMLAWLKRALHRS